MLARELRERGGEGRGAHELSPHHLERDHVNVSVGDRPDMRGLGNSRLDAFDEIKRAIDFAKWPQRKGEIAHGGDAEVLPETKREIAVARGIEYGERLFAMTSRSVKVAFNPFGDAGEAMRDAGFRRLRTRLDLAEESDRVLAHPW